jgi:hypothetical protein
MNNQFFKSLLASRSERNYPLHKEYWQYQLIYSSSIGFLCYKQKQLENKYEKNILLYAIARYYTSETRKVSRT